MTKTDNLTPTSPTVPAAQQTLTIDWDRYGEMLEASDLSDAEKRAFLETLWSIAVSFVDLGFGIHPLQLVAENSCEQQDDITKFIASESATVVSSKDIPTSEFNAAADVPPRATQEGPVK